MALRTENRVSRHVTGSDSELESGITLLAADPHAAGQSVTAMAYRRRQSPVHSSDHRESRWLVVYTLHRGQ